MKRSIFAIALLAAIMAGAAAAQEGTESWTNGGSGMLVGEIKTDRTGKYMMNINERWLPVDTKAFTAEDEYGQRTDIQALRVPFMAKLQYRTLDTDDGEQVTVIGLKVLEQYAYKANGDIVRPGHDTPFGAENMEHPEYEQNLREKERTR
jgi:hypothetical protein